MVASPLQLAIRLRDRLPERLSSRLRGAQWRYHLRDVPPPPSMPGAEVRLLIAPVNSAGQAYHWARAAEQLPGVRAGNLMVGDSAMRYPATWRVEARHMSLSRRWRLGFERSLRNAVSHVIIESAQPLFRTASGGDVEADVEQLRAWGIKVALLYHGSDIRSPAPHLRAVPTSPFRIMDARLVEHFERQSATRKAMNARLGAPVFVSTSGLLQDVPSATWLPLVIDTEQWTSDRPVLSDPVPLVVHSPSSPVIKRSDLIDPVLRQLESEGRIRYRRLEGVPNAELPAVFAEADVLVDTVGIGGVGVAALEAMMARCVVMAFVPSYIRDHLESATGTALPVRSTTPATLRDDLLAVLDDMPAARERTERGVEFVRAHHDGRRSAAALREFLGRPAS